MRERTVRRLLVLFPILFAIAGLAFVWVLAQFIL